MQGEQEQEPEEQWSVSEFFLKLKQYKNLREEDQKQYFQKLIKYFLKYLQKLKGELKIESSTQKTIIPPTYSYQEKISIFNKIKLLNQLIQDNNLNNTVQYQYEAKIQQVKREIQSTIQSKWKKLDLSDIKLPFQLQLLQPIKNLIIQLDLSKTSIKRIDFHSFPRLQKLNLSSCIQLEEINLNEFENLSQLILRNTQIKKLELKSLQTKLQTLDLSQCKQLPEMIGDIFNGLTFLNLSNTQIKKINLTAYPKLKTLDLSGCKQLSEISLQEHENLTFLNLNNSNISKLELKSLPKLEKLDLLICQELQYLQMNELDNLIYLLLNNQKLKQNLSDLLVKLPSLNYLKLQICKDLSQISLKNIKYLKEVDLTNNKNIKKIKIQSIQSLKWINLSGCTQLAEITLIKLYNLENLNLSNTKIKNLTLNSMSKLKWISLSACGCLESIKLNNLDSLTHLDLANTKLKTIQLNSIAKLQELNLIGCSQAVEITLINIANYKILKIKNLKSLLKFNLNSQLYDIIQQQQCLCFLVLKKKTCKEYDIILCAQSKFDYVPEQIQKPNIYIKNYQKIENKEEESQSLSVLNQNAKYCMTKLNQLFLNYKENSPQYKQKIKNVIRSIIQYSKKLNLQIKALENNAQKSDVDSLQELNQFKQAFKVQPLSSFKNLQRFVMLSQNNDQDDIETLTQIFYLGLGEIKYSFGRVCQSTYKIQQYVIIMYLSNIYIYSMKILAIAKNYKVQKAESFNHNRNFIKSQLMQSLQSINDQNNSTEIRQILQNQKVQCDKNITQDSVFTNIFLLYQSLTQSKQRFNQLKILKQTLRKYNQKLSSFFKKHLYQKVKQLPQINVEQFKKFRQKQNFITKILIQTSLKGVNACEKFIQYSFQRQQKQELRQIFEQCRQVINACEEQKSLNEYLFQRQQRQELQQMHNQSEQMLQKI